MGSYQCDCHAGFNLLADNLNCADINECSQDNGGCEQICNNTIGSYECSCTDGYKLDFNGLNCTGSTIKFNQSLYSITNEALKPMLILSDTLSTDVIVQIVVVDSKNAAFGEVDYYRSGPYNVTIPAGVTSVSFNIFTLDDDMLEENETFSLTINTDSLPDGITTGSPSEVIVMIRNNNTECTIPKLDVVFVLDVSISIKDEDNFAVMKHFVKNTGGLININLNDSLAAVVLFGGNAWIRFSLTEHTEVNSFQNAVNDIKYKQVKQVGTNTPDALNLLRIAGQDGRLGLRNNTIKIVVLITDGRPFLKHLNISSDQAAAETKKAATKLHNSGMYDQVYSVGIEGKKRIGKVLDYIAYPPSLVYHISGFDALLFQLLTQDFASSFCNDDVEPPQK